MHVADTVTATDHNSRSRRIRKAQPRAKIGKVRIDQSLSIHSSRRNGSDTAGLRITWRDGQNRLRNGIEVRKQIVLLRVRRTILPAQTQVQRQIGKDLPVV